VPENWHEVTLLHLINLEAWRGKETDPVGLLSCFLDIDPELLANQKRRYWNELLTVLSFVFSPPKWQGLKMKDRIKIGDKTIKVPKRLELETWGQAVAAMMEASKCENEADYIKAVPELLTIYFQPLYDGKFSRHRLEYVKGLIMQMPAIEAVPVGFFFFKKLMKSQIYGMIGLTRSRLILKKIFFLIQQGGQS